MWSRRKSLSGGDGQFAAKISVGQFGATVWEIEADEEGEKLPKMR
jgi:hypothetical protein